MTTFAWARCGALIPNAEGGVTCGQCGAVNAAPRRDATPVEVRAGASAIDPSGARRDLAWPRCRTPMSGGVIEAVEFDGCGLLRRDLGRQQQQPRLARRAAEHLRQHGRPRRCQRHCDAALRRGAGSWRRPDIALVSIRPSNVIGHTLDVHTFEVKRADSWDINAIYQASAHGRRATYAYAFFEGQADDNRSKGRLKDCEACARHLSVGLIVAARPGDHGTWNVQVEPKRNAVEPSELESFVADHISEEGKEKMRAWQDAAHRRP